jgi:hypothetical protein
LRDLGPPSTIELLGWTAAGVFTTSYFFTRPGILRRVQMLGAALWLVYGVLLAAYPVVVANLMNLVAMGWSEWRAARRGAQTEEVATVVARS